MFGGDRVPEYAVRHHPTIRQVNVCAELDGNHLTVHLDNNTFQPAAYPFVAFFVVAIYFHCIADFIVMFGSGASHECKLCHWASPSWSSWFIVARSLFVGKRFGCHCAAVFSWMACWKRTRTPSNGMRCIMGSKNPSTISRSASFSGMPRDFR